MRQKCDILRAGVGLLIHETVGVYEMRGVEMKVLGQPIHVVHEQPHVGFAFYHECFEKSQLLALGLAYSHPAQEA